MFTQNQLCSYKHHRVLFPGRSSFHGPIFHSIPNLLVKTLISQPHQSPIFSSAFSPDSFNFEEQSTSSDQGRHLKKPQWRVMTRDSSSIFVSFICFCFAFLPLSHVVLSYFHAFYCFYCLSVFYCLRTLVRFWS